jgi:hypothetical protein
MEQMTEQILERLLAGQEHMMAKMKAGYLEMTARLEAKIEAKMDSHHVKFEVLQGTFVSWMDVHHAKTKTNHEELMTTIKASHERIETLIDVSQEATEAYPEIVEVNPAEMESEAVHEEISKEEAAVKSFGALKKQHGDRHLAVGRCGKLKEQTQGKGGSWKKLAAACRGITHHAGVAWCKGHGHHTEIRYEVLDQFLM